MLYKEYIKIKALSVHRIGNKAAAEGIELSGAPVDLDDTLGEILKMYFLAAFKDEERYCFCHPTAKDLNAVYTYVSNAFKDCRTFHEQSKNIARYLYEQSEHPKIKRGDLYIVYFKDCILDGETVDAIGLFKSENKDTYIKLNRVAGGFCVESQTGMSLNKLDKGCLIFNIEKENGYLVAIVDNTNKGVEAKFWTDDFLHVRPYKNSYNQTKNMLSLCTNFVAQLPENDGKIEKVTFLNRSIDALKEDFVDVNAFAKKIFEKPELVSEFRDYKETYQREQDVDIDDCFKTASNAISHRGVRRMTTIKLDKNFDINIHGGEKYIVRGYDQIKKLYYYKLFFKEEK